MGLTSRLADLGAFWLTLLEKEGRIEQTTINEYRRTFTNEVLPAIGGLRLREVTTGRLEQLILGLPSSNRQRKVKVVLEAVPGGASETTRPRCAMASSS